MEWAPFWGSLNLLYFFLSLLWSSLFLKRREKVTLKNCLLQVVLKSTIWNWGRVSAALFQEERLLGFTLVTYMRHLEKHIFFNFIQCVYLDNNTVPFQLTFSLCSYFSGETLLFLSIPLPLPISLFFCLCLFF